MAEQEAPPTAWPDIKHGQPAIFYGWRGVGGGTGMLTDRARGKFGRDHMLGDGVYVAPHKAGAEPFGDPQPHKVTLHNPYVIDHTNETSLSKFDPDEARRAGHDGIVIKKGQGGFGRGQEDMRQAMVFPEFAHQVQKLDSMPEPKGMWAKGAPVVHNETGQTGVIHTHPVDMYGGKMMKVKWKGNPKPETLTERQVHLAEQEKGTAHPDPFTEETPELGDETEPTTPSMEKQGAKEVTVAGLAVVAADTGRVCMLQRAVDDDDPASGKWEFPGGHLEEGESPLEGAIREWKEEVGCELPPGEVVGSWVSPNGIYQGFVYLISSENLLVINNDEEARPVDNPDVEWVEE